MAAPAKSSAPTASSAPASNSYGNTAVSAPSTTKNMASPAQNFE